MKQNAVLLVSNKETFSIHGMESKLEEMGYEGVYVTDDLEELAEVEETSNLLVYYMDEKIPIDTNFVVYLKDLCMEKEKSLILIGRKEEYEQVLKNMPPKCINAWFERPLDMRKFLQTVQDLKNSMIMLAMLKTVLIVDDDVAYMQMIRDWLKDTYQIVMANSGVKAIKWLTNNKADLVLLDYEMPVLNGPTFFEMLKSDPDSDVVPVMFLTGQMTKSSVVTAMKLKPIDYLLKSITRSELRDKLANYFEKQKGLS